MNKLYFSKTDIVYDSIQYLIYRCTDATTPGQSGPDPNGNEEGDAKLPRVQNWSFTTTSSLVLHPEQYFVVIN